MSASTGKELAKSLVELNMNILRWNREHIEKSFNINGKNRCGELTMRQFHVLLLMRTTGIRTISDLANWLNISKSSMSIMVNRLREGGYVEKIKTDESSDGRISYFRLTEKGISEVHQAEEQLIENIAGCFSTFSEEAIEKYCSHLRELNELVKTGGFGE